MNVNQGVLMLSSCTIQGKKRFKTLEKFMVLIVTVLCLFCVYTGQVYARESFTISAPMPISDEVEWGNKEISYSSSSTESPVITVKSGGVLKITNESYFHLETFGSLTAIKVEEGGKLLIDRSIFDAPNAANDDAFILIDGGEIQIINESRLLGKNTSAKGNYLRVTGGSLTMDSSYVSVSVNSFSASYPGIISTISSDVQLKDSTFEDCVVSKGGVVSAFEDKSFRAENINSFGNSSVQVLSGMIFAEKTNVVIEGESLAIRAVSELDFRPCSDFLFIVHDDFGKGMFF